MNLVRMELKINIRSVIVWMISIIVLYALLMVGMFKLYMYAKEDIQRVLTNFPPAFAKAFGLEMENIFSYGGFYNFSFEYLSLIGGAMAASISISIFAREKRTKCTDFLLTKPISRVAIFGQKLLACGILLGISNILYLVASVIIYHLADESEISDWRVLYAGLGFFFTQCVFMAVGIIYAIWIKKIRSTSGAATLFALTGFILTALANVLEEEELALFAPLLYFQPYDIFLGENYKAKYVMAAIIIIVVSTVLAYVRFIKADAQQL